MIKIKSFFTFIFAMTLISFEILAERDISLAKEQSDMPGYQKFLLVKSGDETESNKKENLLNQDMYELISNRFILKVPNVGGGEKSSPKKLNRNNFWFLRQG